MKPKIRKDRKHGVWTVKDCQGTVSFWSLWESAVSYALYGNLSGVN